MRVAQLSLISDDMIYHACMVQGWRRTCFSFYIISLTLVIFDAYIDGIDRGILGGYTTVTTK